MSKYIKLNAAIRILWELSMPLCDYESGVKQLESLPTIDIVHCGECKCCRDERIEEYMPLYIYCEKWNHETGFDDYCSAGERIDNE